MTNARDEPDDVSHEREDEEYRKTENGTNISHSLSGSFFSIFLKLYRSKNLIGQGLPSRSAGRQFIRSDGLFYAIVEPVSGPSGDRESF